MHGLARTLKVVGTVIGVVVLVWVAMAADAGMFIPYDGRLAVKPGRITPGPLAEKKRIIDLGGQQVAYIDVGAGEPVILLHGCPFSVYEWHDLIPVLATKYRVIAPDLIGLGDTPVRLNGDYGLPQDVKMVRALMDKLGLKSARFIGHDHGGAIVQLLMQRDPGRIDMAIITNAEAYDQWPSKPETPDLHLITNPITSPLLYEAIKLRPVQRDLLRIAVNNPATLTDEMMDGFLEPLAADGLRWQRTRRFFQGQLDRANTGLTAKAVPAMRRFARPVLIVWGAKDTNFGPDIGVRLARDIPGVVGVHWMRNSAHLPMLEQAGEYANVAMQFLASGQPSPDEKVALHAVRRG
jgi:pimeloyl-ACP methyl ester carboxylesterase